MSTGIMSRSVVVLGAALVVLSAALPAAAQSSGSKTPPRVIILATGGTIAGVQPKEGDPGYKSGSLSVESLIQAAPGVEKLAKLEGEQIASIGSQDMNDEVWLKLATRANALLAQKDVAGIVVTHGTDTMEETAYFLNLVIRSDKPVVLVGSMRPATSTSPDGPLNLYNAVSVAADPDARGLGVMVVSNDDLFAARGITKTNTTDVQTMVSPGRGQLGEAYYGENRIYNRPTEKNTSKSEFSLDGVKALPRVDVVYATEGVDAVAVQAAVAAGARGIVLAGVGDGNATKAMIDALAAAAKQGVVVVRSTRVGTGFVRRNIELNDDQLGFVAAMDLNPQKARVLLRMALTKTTDVAKIQRYFEEY